VTARGSWKRVERKVAEKLGGERVPLSGEMSKHTSADVMGTPEYVEVKMQPDPTAHTHLMSVHETARRYDRRPIVVYEAVDGPTWIATWLEHYAEDRWQTGRYDLPHIQLQDLKGRGVFQHRVAKRLPHRALVEDTIQAAREEDKPPVVVVHKKGSPKQVALVAFRSQVPAVQDGEA